MTETIDIVRVVASLVAHELADARKTSVLLDPLASISAATELSEGGLAVDSLELLRLAGAVNEFFHLHESSVEDYLLHCRTIGAWAEIVQASWEAGQERLTFRTSGSTGVPQRCTHSLARLARETDVHVAMFGDTRRVLGCVPCHHIYGFLFTVLLPAKLNCETLDVRPWSSSRLHRELRGSDLIVASPSYWEYLSRSTDRFDPAIRGVSSTAALPEGLFTRLQQQGVRLTEIYGSTETAGIASRSEAHAPFALFPYWERTGGTLGLRPLESVEVGAALEQFQPTDHLNWTGSRTFLLEGRCDGAVQVGGINVSTEHVAARIAAHPTVKECAVRLMDPHEGNRLKAFVVWRDGHSSDEAASNLREWMQREFNASERPTAVVFGSALPRSIYGKLQNWDAADLPRSAV